MWEFPNSVSNAAARATAKLNMGYSYGKPVIVKTAADGWVVLVTSGFNNGTNAGDSGGDGLGHLFVLNPKTGDLIKDIPTTGCGATPLTTPCGLSQISAWVDNADIDNTVDLRVRRRPERQCVALRFHRQQHQQLECRQVRDAERLKRCDAARDDGPGAR